MIRLYWSLIAIFTAIAVHGSVVLAIPLLTLKRNINALAQQEGSNHFFLMDAAEQQRLFPTFPLQSVVGACAFDITSGPVDFIATMPEGFWTLAIYSSTGDMLYAANNRQAGTNSFTLRLQRAQSFFEMLREKKDDDSPLGKAWTVRMTDPKGLAVVWQPVPDAVLRPRIAGTISGTMCRQVKADQP